MIDKLAASGGTKLSFSPEAMTCLQRYPWPGNVRELINLVERLAILFPQGDIDEANLPDKYKEAPVSVSIEDAVRRRHKMSVICCTKYCKRMQLDLHPTFPEEGLNLKETLAEFEVRMIRQALEKQQGVVSRAAVLLAFAAQLWLRRCVSMGLLCKSCAIKSQHLST